jgi:hypothetical protein
MSHLRAFVPTLLLTALSAQTVPAQVTSTPGSVTGQVRSVETSAPLSGALVVLLASGRTAVTDAAGRFHLRDVPAGEHRLEARFLGHHALPMSVEVRAGEEVRLDLRLELDPVELEGVAVEGRQRSGPPAELRGFYERKARGIGHYITRDQIERQQPSRVTDVLRRVPGVRISPVTSSYGIEDVVQMGRSQGSRGRPCPVSYYLNGTPFELTSVGLNTEIRPVDVEAIEVYTGASQLPAEFNSMVRRSACGVIVIWTRSRVGR